MRTIKTSIKSSTVNWGGETGGAWELTNKINKDHHLLQCFSDISKAISVVIPKKELFFHVRKAVAELFTEESLTKISVDVHSGESDTIIMERRIRSDIPDPAVIVECYNTLISIAAILVKHISFGLETKVDLFWVERSRSQSPSAKKIRIWLNQLLSELQSIPGVELPPVRKALAISNIVEEVRIEMTVE